MIAESAADTPAATPNRAGEAENVVVINVPRGGSRREADDPDKKIVCSCYCAGRRRNCTRTKIKFGAEVLILLALAALDLAVALTSDPAEAAECECGPASTGAARYLALLNVVVLAIVRPPAWGRVGGASRD